MSGGVLRFEIKFRFINIRRVVNDISRRFGVAMPLGLRICMSVLSDLVVVKEKHFVITIDSSMIVMFVCACDLCFLVSKAIVDLHGGRITVDSQGENQGCTFTLCWPVEPPSSRRSSIARNGNPATGTTTTTAS